jgi:hypothetical protein
MENTKKSIRIKMYRSWITWKVALIQAISASILIYTVFFWILPQIDENAKPFSENSGTHAFMAVSPMAFVTYIYLAGQSLAWVGRGARFGKHAKSFFRFESNGPVRASDARLLLTRSLRYDSAVEATRLLDQGYLVDIEFWDDDAKDVKSKLPEYISMRKL